MLGFLAKQGPCECSRGDQECKILLLLRCALLAKNSAAVNIFFHWKKLVQKRQSGSCFWSIFLWLLLGLVMVVMPSLIFFFAVGIQRHCTDSSWISIAVWTHQWCLEKRFLPHVWRAFRHSHQASWHQILKRPAGIAAYIVSSRPNSCAPTHSWTAH